MVERRRKNRDTEVDERRRKGSRRIVRRWGGGTRAAAARSRRTQDRRIGHLKVFEGEEKQDRVYPLKDKDVYYVGRSSDVDIPLSDMKVSRKHIKIERRGNRYRVVDLGSRNGTFLNGKRVRMALLSDGDQIRIGFTVLQFFLAEAGTHIVESRMKKQTCSLCGKDVSESDILAGKAEQLEGNIYCPDCVKTVGAVDKDEMVSATPTDLHPPVTERIPKEGLYSPSAEGGKVEESVKSEDTDAAERVSAKASHETITDVHPEGVNDASILPPEAEPGTDDIENMDIDKLLEE